MSVSHHQESTVTYKSPSAVANKSPSAVANKSFSTVANKSPPSIVKAPLPKEVRPPLAPLTHLNQVHSVNSSSFKQVNQAAARPVDLKPASSLSGQSPMVPQSQGKKNVKYDFLFFNRHSSLCC